LEDRTLLSSSSLSDHLPFLSSIVVAPPAPMSASARPFAASLDARGTSAFTPEASSAAGHDFVESHREARLDELYERSNEGWRGLIAVLHLPDPATSREEVSLDAPERAVSPPGTHPEPTVAVSGPGAPAIGKSVETPGGASLLSRSGDPINVPVLSALPPDTEAPVSPAVLAAESSGETLAALPALLPQVLSLAPKAAALLEGGLPFDLPALKQGVDDFFARLADHGPPADGLRRWVRLGPWLIVVAAGAFEIARRWERKASRLTVPGDVDLRPTGLITEDE